MPIDFSKIPSPCYVIDEELLHKNLGLISNVKENAGVEIIMAFKGFSMWKAFPLIRQYISGAAASGAYEARLAVEEMKSLAHTYSPAFTKDDFDEVLNNSSHITFNSLAQYNKFSQQLIQYPKKISAGLRINPEYSEISNGLYNPCSPGSRLGIIVEDLKEGLPQGIEGLHFHVLFEDQ